VILQCLDLKLPQVQENMRGIEMELHDGNFPLLHQATFTTDDEEAFTGAKYAILLGAFPQQHGKERREVMEKNTMIFRTVGYAVDNFASKDCRVLTVGHPACTNALLCAYYAPGSAKDHFFALSRLDQNRVVGQIARRAEVNVDDVKNVVVWGNGARAVDVDNTIVKGKPLHSVLSSDKDKQWLTEGLACEVQTRGTKIHEARRASSAMSAARAVVDHIRDLHFGTRPGEFISMGVWSDGNEYGISDGLMFSMPVTCTGRGCFYIAKGLTISEQVRERIRDAESDLSADRDLAQEFCRKHGVQISVS